MVSNAKGRKHNTGARQEPVRSEGTDAAEHDLRLLRLFNHYRHDWMNDIQILMGYVQLKKYDKLQPLMEKIKDKVRQESYISKLGIPSLIVHLLAFQAEVKEVSLQVSIPEEIRLSELAEPEAMVDALKAALDLFREEAVEAEMDAGMLLLELVHDNGKLVVTLRYEGEYDPSRIVTKERLFSGLWEDKGGRLNSSYAEKLAVWTIHWPFRTAT